MFQLQPMQQNTEQTLTLPNLMEKLESDQYSAAVAVTGTWRGTSREKSYTELGWESLSCRRWSRRLTLFCKFINNLSPVFSYNGSNPTVSSIAVLTSQSGCHWANKGKDRQFQI